MDFSWAKTVGNSLRDVKQELVFQSIFSLLCCFLQIYMSSSDKQN